MGTNDKRKDFIDDDIFENNIEEKINELYEKTRQIVEINKNTPETDNEILKNINTYFSEIGIWDNTIDVFVETESCRKLEDEKNNNNGINPFDKKHLRNIIATQFDGYMDNDKELVANMIFMANRMSKIPEMIMSNIGWDEKKKNNLKNILMLCKENGYDYSNGDLNKKIFEKVRNNFNITYDEFELYSKLDYCKNMFYKIKHNKINQGIEKGFIEDYTYLDTSKTSESDGYRNLRMDVPGYIHPYVVHVEKDFYRKNTGKNIDEQKIERCDEKIPYIPMINFKMTKEQRDYIKKLKQDRVLFVNMPFFKYLLNSVEKFEYQELKEERRKQRLENNNNNNVSDVPPKVKHKMSVEMINANIELNDRMYEHLLTMCESVTDQEVLKSYKQKIEEQNEGETRYNTGTYARVKKYVDYINETENKNYTEEQKEKEVANIYVFMKISEQYVRSCQRDKDNQGNMKRAYDSYIVGFDKFKENVKNGKSLEDIQKDARIKKTIRKPKEIKPNEVEKEETPKTEKIQTQKKEKTHKTQGPKKEKKAKRPYTRKTTGKKSIREYSNEDISAKNSEMKAIIDEMDEKITYNTERVALLEEHARLAEEIRAKQKELDNVTKRIWDLEEAFSKNTKEERNK